MTVHSQPGLHFQPVGGHAVKGAKQAVEAGQDAQVLSQIIQMALFHNPWGHIAVGDALIAHNSGGEPVVEVHPGQPLHIESGNSIVASLQDVSNMKPVVSNPSATFEDLLKGVEVAATDEQLAYQVDLIIAKLQRKRRNVSQNVLEQFTNLTGGKDFSAFAEHLNNSTIKEAAAELLSHREAFAVLDRDKTYRKRSVVIDHHEDELIDHTRGYGDGQKPEDYLESFKDFITNNMNAIVALRTVCTKPSELTRDALKSLKLELDRHDFTEKQLNSAWNEMTNQDIVADIIAFIRQQALGSTLISHESRVKNAFAKLRLNHNFNKTQLDWLSRIEKAMLAETVLDKQIFEMGAFKIAGGFTNIDRRFGGTLEEIISELNEYLYEDGGVA